MLILYVVVGKKLRPFFFLTFTLVCTPFAWSETVRIASYNVENYLVMDRMVSGRWQEEYPKPSKERRIVRSVINQANPDILAIQEIGERAFLNELWKDLKYD